MVIFEFLFRVAISFMVWFIVCFQLCIFDNELYRVFRYWPYFDGVSEVRLILNEFYIILLHSFVAWYFIFMFHIWFMFKDALNFIESYYLLKWIVIGFLSLLCSVVFSSCYLPFIIGYSISDDVSTYLNIYFNWLFYFIIFSQLFVIRVVIYDVGYFDIVYLISYRVYLISFILLFNWVMMFLLCRFDSLFLLLFISFIIFIIHERLLFIEILVEVVTYSISHRFDCYEIIDFD